MLARFLDRLFDDGDIAFDAAPPHPTPDVDAAASILRRAFADYRLEFAGPLIDFDDKTALKAAEFTHRACWYLVHRDANADEVRDRLNTPGPPQTPEHHLSADLTFRHLPQLHRRARALSPDDVLTAKLIEALRTFPLCGVMSDIDEPPQTPIEFAGHMGLEMLYAERYVKRPRENWLPAGRIAEYVELLKQRTV